MKTEPNRTRLNAVPLVTTTRRHFLAQAATLTAGLVAGAQQHGQAAEAPSPGGGIAARKFKVCLSPGMIGVRATMKEALGLAVQFGFEAIEPVIGELGTMSGDGLNDFRAEMKAKGLAWGAASTGMPFGRPEEEYQAWLGKLPEIARPLQQAGVTRIATWISPGENQLTYVTNFRRHARRIGEAARVFAEHGLAFGLEYVGPRTSWVRSRFPFVHSMREMRELIAEAGQPNLGLLLDSWHWHTAGETVADLRSLRAADVVSVHLNDAPAGVAVEEQVDNRRALPAATGVIDIGGFLNALVAIGYDGPVAAEPFDAELRQQPRDQALQRTMDAIRKAFSRG